MKACAFVVGGLLVAGLYGLAHAGYAVWLPLASFGFLMAWRSTPESMAVSEDCFEAMRDVGVSQEAAAELLGITKSQLSAQKVGRERLNLTGLLAVLGKEFRVAFGKRMLAREGVTVPERGVVDLITEIRSLLVQGQKQQERAA